MRQLFLSLLACAGSLSIADGADDGHWPSFRGPFASGVADGPDLPVRWSAETGEGIRYRAAIPGLAHSSPIIWGGRIFLTTAVSTDPAADFTPGLYGSGEASADRSEQEWRVICLDKETGKTLWQQVSARGVPRDKRHIKATYANATPATDGRHVVAFFGSEGFFAYTVEGKLLWKKDLGRLDVGAYDIPSYEWGSASSPVIHGGTVFAQCDTQGESFVIALKVETGEVLWKTPRDELPSWGTPTLYPGGGGRAPELITNGSNFIRGYDPASGAELWRLGGSSKITAPTPVFADGIFIVASGRAPERPIFAIRAGARGEITPENGLAWSHTRRGPYMPTPLIYRGQVYVLNNDGPFACYDLPTGKERYHLRLPHRGDGFSASPVAGNGRLYLAGENGEVLVIEAGDTFREPVANEVGEPIMATPAISNGVIYVRGARHLFAIGKGGGGG
jgi:outer membrane protein assembly factor BamB